MEQLISPQKAALMLGVCTNTLINWEREGKLKCHRTLGGHRRYYLQEIQRLLDIVMGKE